jgi:hypothetical protein
MLMQIFIVQVTRSQRVLSTTISPLLAVVLSSSSNDYHIALLFLIQVRALASNTSILRSLDMRVNSVLRTSNQSSSSSFTLMIEPVDVFVLQRLRLMNTIANTSKVKLYRKIWYLVLYCTDESSNVYAQASMLYSMASRGLGSQ